MKRTVWLDMLRIMACFAIILIHISVHFYYSQHEDVHLAGIIWDSIVRWGVPIFIMISGTLFLNPEKQINFNSLYNKYIYRLFIALVFWNTIYQGIFECIVPCIINKEPFITYIPKLFELHFHMWFMPMMIGIYIVIPLLKAIVNHKLEKYFILLWLTYHFLHTITTLNIPHRELAFSILDSFQINMIVGYSGYFMFGYYLSKQNINKNLFIIAICTLFISIILTIIGTFYYNDERLWNGIPFNIIMLSLSVFVCGKYLFSTYTTNKQANKKTNILSLITPNIFGIYLIHAFFLHLLWFIWNDMQIVENFILTLVYIPILTFIVFIVSLFTIKMMRKIPIFRKLC